MSIERIGGNTGWYYGNWLWQVRGIIDRLLGGVGMGRGRRDPDKLRVGDVVDCWRVELYDPPKRLTLIAEMKLPEARRVLDLFAALSHQTNFAIGCYCKDESRCHRSILRELLEQRGADIRGVLFYGLSILYPKCSAVCGEASKAQPIDFNLWN